MVEAVLESGDANTSHPLAVAQRTASSLVSTPNMEASLATSAVDTSGFGTTRREEQEDWELIGESHVVKHVTQPASDASWFPHVPTRPG